MEDGKIVFCDEQCIRNSFDTILNTVNKLGLVGYGAVNIISSMFFLSKGKVPIYDYYAHVAVKALIFGKNPQDVYVAVPGKVECSRVDKKKRSAVNLLIEYMHMLKLLDEDDEFVNKDSMYISRELDRVLWVYGHTNPKPERTLNASFFINI